MRSTGNNRTTAAFRDTLLAAGYAVLTSIVLVRFRPIHRSAIVYTLPFALVLAWWLSISPSNEREWQPDVARLPLARMEGDIVHIDNVSDRRSRHPSA